MLCGAEPLWEKHFSRLFPTPALPGSGSAGRQRPRVALSAFVGFVRALNPTGQLPVSSFNVGPTLFMVKQSASTPVSLFSKGEDLTALPGREHYPR